MLGVPKTWVYEQSRAGRIPTVPLGRYRRFRPEAIEAWVEEASAAATSRSSDGRAVAVDGPALSWNWLAGGTRRDAQRALDVVRPWMTGGRRVKRRLGLKRPPGTSDGLTRNQAEAELRCRIT